MKQLHWLRLSVSGNETASFRFHSKIFLKRKWASWQYWTEILTIKADRAGTFTDGLSSYNT